MRINAIISTLLFICMQSCNTSNISKYIGTYRLDATKSKLGQYKSVDSLLDLRLTIKADGTFEFSKEVPFLLSKNGNWRLEYIVPTDLPPFYKCIFYFVGNPREEILRPIDEEITECYFNSPVSREGYEQVELLQFKREK